LVDGFSSLIALQYRQRQAMCFFGGHIWPSLFRASPVPLGPLTLYLDVQGDSTLYTDLLFSKTSALKPNHLLAALSIPVSRSYSQGFAELHRKQPGKKRPVQRCDSHFPQRGSGFTCKILAIQILHPELTMLPA